MANLTTPKVKICGLTRPDDAASAAEAGAAYLGLVFFPPSPRHVDEHQAREIAAAIPAGVVKVALTVDPDDALLDTLAALPIDMIQLHGKEAPACVSEVKARLGLPVMKAIGIRDASDLSAIPVYAAVADQLLVDAKPPKGATRPGGNALAFDWQLVAGRRWPVPWMLAGGLTADNVALALSKTGAAQVDVSTGVESAPGIKDPARMRAFIEAASKPAAPALG